MRFRAIPLFVAAAFMAAAPAHAQRQSLSDRVAVLEQRAADPQANLDLLNQVTTLRSQMQSLQGTLEQLQHDNEQLKQQIKDQYLDLDGRLNHLEGGASPTAVPAATPVSGVAPAAASATPATAATAAASAEERPTYDRAFEALKNGQYDQSSQLFLGFLQTYPNSVYSPNALYWLGESYYATRNFQLAEVQFRDLVDRYPTHDKAAGGLLKLGLAQYGEGKSKEAQQTLQQVISRYPGSDAARLARDRLQSIQLGQQLR